MSAYTVQITNYVNTNFPSPDFSATTRTQMIALGEACAALVIPGRSAEERIVAIKELIEANSYFGLVPTDSEYYEQILEMCEYCLNLAIGANSPAGSGALVLYATMSQAGVAAPAFDVAPAINTMGEVPTFGYNAPGQYDLNFATTTPFLVTSKCEIWIGRNVPASTYITWSIAAPNQLVINTQTMSSNILTGVITGADADALLNGTEIKIVIYP